MTIFFFWGLMRPFPKHMWWIRIWIEVPKMLNPCNLELSLTEKLICESSEHLPSWLFTVGWTVQTCLCTSVVPLNQNRLCQHGLRITVTKRFHPTGLLWWLLLKLNARSIHVGRCLNILNGSVVVQLLDSWAKNSSCINLMMDTLKLGFCSAIALQNTQSPARMQPIHLK